MSSLALASVAEMAGTLPHVSKDHRFDSHPVRTYLGCRFDPQSSSQREATKGCFSLKLMFISLSLLLFLKAMKKMSSGENKKIILNHMSISTDS